jgi:fructose-specific component phosphotransferase system IIB-like protein
MTAYLVLILVVVSQAGPAYVGIKIPMVDMAACEAWMAHPEQMLTHGVAKAEMGCEPIPGQPV